MIAANHRPESKRSSSHQVANSKRARIVAPPDNSAWSDHLKISASAAVRISDSTSAVALSNKRQAQEFREEGDTVRFEGYTIIKVSPDEADDSGRVKLLKQEWEAEAFKFLSSTMALSKAELGKYGELQVTSFEEFDGKTERILARARAVFGPNIAIALEGDLKELSDRSYSNYRRLLAAHFGERLEEYDRFADRFSDFAAKQVGFVPGFIR